jgi:hypothetical protein
MTNAAFQTAIAKRDWETAAAMVDAVISSERDTSGLMDWIANGDYDGIETPESVAAEWTALDEQQEGIDY